MENLLTPEKILEMLGISKYELQTKTIRFNPKEIKEWLDKARVEVNPLVKR